MESHDDQRLKLIEEKIDALMTAQIIIGDELRDVIDSVYGELSFAPRGIVSEQINILEAIKNPHKSGGDVE